MPDFKNVKSKIEAPRAPKQAAHAVRVPIGVVRRAKTQVGMPLDDRLQDLAEQRTMAAQRRKALLQSYTEAARLQLKKCKMRPMDTEGKPVGAATAPLMRAGGRDGMHLSPMEAAADEGGARMPLSPDLRRQRKALPKVGKTEPAEEECTPDPASEPTMAAAAATAAAPGMQPSSLPQEQQGDCVADTSSQAQTEDGTNGAVQVPAKNREEASDTAADGGPLPLAAASENEDDDAQALDQQRQYASSVSTAAESLDAVENITGDLRQRGGEAPPTDGQPSDLPSD
jgi:hypothetical protein